MTQRERHDQRIPRRALSPTARRLVTAARKLLARGGFEALTVEAVAAEAGAYRDSVRYYFGSKAAFVAAVVDSLGPRPERRRRRGDARLPAGAPRVHSLVAGDRAARRATAPPSRLLRDLPARAPGRGAARARRGLYEWYRDLYAGRHGRRRRRRLRRRACALFASLMVAMTDGLAVQKLLDPDGVDRRGPLRALGRRPAARVRERGWVEPRPAHGRRPARAQPRRRPPASPATHYHPHLQSPERGVLSARVCGARMGGTVGHRGQHTVSS